MDKEQAFEAWWKKERTRLALDFHSKESVKLGYLAAPSTSSAGEVVESAITDDTIKELHKIPRREDN